MSKERKRDYWNHYFKFVELTEMANEKVREKHSKCDSVKDWLHANYVLSNIPEKYHTFEFDKIKKKILTVEKNLESIETIQKYITNIDNAAQKGIGLYLSGPHGVAKTTMSIIILKEAIKNNYKSFFCKSADVINFARAGWKNDDKRQYWEYIIDVMDFLVIDDIVRLFQMNEKESIHIDEIFTKRDDSNKVTIITANHQLEDNRDLFGEALFSNFKERLIEVDLIGDDYREIIGQNLLNDLIE